MTAQTIPSAAPPAVSPATRLLNVLPGVALLFGIGLLGKLLEHIFTVLRTQQHLPMPRIEYVLWAIILGLIVSNTFGVAPIFRPGIATYELWLKLGIVLVGAKFILQDVLHIGGLSLALVAVELILSLSVMTLLGRIFKLPPKLTSLLAIGSSICGVTAIMAAQGAIEPAEEETSTAIAAILTLGAISLFIFPLIGHWLHMSDLSYGLWAGLGIDNTAEVTAAGNLYSDAAGKVAVLAKTARNAMIGFVVLGYAIHWARKEKTAGVTNKAAFLWNKFPKFVLGFLLISAIATAHVFNKEQLTSLANLSRWAFLLTFAGVGLRTNIGDMRKQGLRPFVVGALGEIVIAALTLGLVFGADKFVR